MLSSAPEQEQIQQEWDTNPRWKDVTRTSPAEDVVALQGSVVEALASPGGGAVGAAARPRVSQRAGRADRQHGRQQVRAA